MAGIDRHDVDAMHRRDSIMREAMHDSVHYVATHSRCKKPGRLDVMLQEISDQITAAARARRQSQKE
ncbi:MAG: hypothetical protein NVS2B16_17680 [Chloroflexota bacterium]